MDGHQDLEHGQELHYGQDDYSEFELVRAHPISRVSESAADPDATAVSLAAWSARGNLPALVAALECLRTSGRPHPSSVVTRLLAHLAPRSMMPVPDPRLWPPSHGSDMVGAGCALCSTTERGATADGSATHTVGAFCAIVSLSWQRCRTVAEQEHT